MNSSNKKIKVILMSAFAVLSLASCANSTKTIKNTAAAPQEETQKEEVGITQRENDLDDYVDLRPDREGAEDNTPLDEGTLIDHIFEFENMSSTGGSREKDHLCSAVSYVTSTDFSGNVAIECVDAGISFSMELESDKAVRVPMIIGINNNNKMNSSLDSIFTITNNDKQVADYSAIVPENGKPAVGAPEGYFDMVQVESMISLAKGKNKIKFNVNINEVNLDYVNLKSSATIVDKTISSWDVPNYSIASKPSETQDGKLQITCGKCGHKNSNRHLPRLTDPVYKVVEEGYIKTYTMTIGGQEVEVARIDNDPANQFIEDKGELKDNVFEFENAEITGNSQKNDHFCGGQSSVYSFDFSNNFCIENIDCGTTFTFNIESSERVKVPYKLNLSALNIVGKQLAEGFIMKNNGHEEYIDASYTVPWSDTYADVGDISSYFNMVEAKGTMNLVKGLNKIDITVNLPGMNIDYFNIQTSAKLTNKTNPYFNETTKPKFSLVTAPTFTKKGVLAVDCAIGTGEKCHREYNYLPALSHKKYIVKPIDNKTANYFINLFGEEILVATDEYQSATPDQIKDNKFEFENAQIEGVSQGIKDHFCASKSLVLSPDFSNNFCVENTNDKTTFTFDIESNKEEYATFDLGMTSNNIKGKILSETISMTNNDDVNACDLSNIIPGVGYTPDIGPDLSPWFNMVTVPGTIKLNKGINKIAITTKMTGINLDYFNIKTSAQLVDNTTSFWNETNMPKFEVVTAPTLENRGTIKLTCPHAACGKNERIYDYIPTLNAEKYIVKTDGYYLNLLGKETKIAAK